MKEDEGDNARERKVMYGLQKLKAQRKKIFLSKIISTRVKFTFYTNTYT